MAYCVVAVLMNFGDLQGHSPIADLYKWDFPYICTAVDNVSTDMMHHTVPVQ